MRKVAVILILAFLSCALSGCYDRREVDDMAYAIALGIDQGKTNVCRVTVQYANPKNISGGGGGGSGGGESTAIMTVEAPTFLSALNMLNASLSKELNISHAKVIVFSRELAEKGITGYMYGLGRSPQFRPSLSVLVSRTTAEDYIKSIKPQLEADPSKYYERTLAAYKYTGFSANTDLFHFQTNMKSYNSQPIAVLAGVNKYDSPEDFSKSGSTSGMKGKNNTFEGDFKAGDVPMTGDVKGQIMGLAVFRGATMVGELDGEEATDYLMVTGKFNHAFFTFPDPLSQKYFVIVDVKQSRFPVHKVEMVNGKPLVHVKVILEGDYSAIQSGVNYEAEKYTRIFEKSAENYYKNEIYRFLKRTSDEFRSDICGFGNDYAGKFATWQKWVDFNWLGKYKDASFDVKVDIKIRRTGLKVKIVPETSGEGGQSAK